MTDRFTMWIIESNYDGTWTPFGSYERSEEDARYHFNNLTTEPRDGWQFRLVKLTFSALEKEIVATTAEAPNEAHR